MGVYSASIILLIVSYLHHYFFDFYFKCFVILVWRSLTAELQFLICTFAVVDEEKQTVKYCYKQPGDRFGNEYPADVSFYEQEDYVYPKDTERTRGDKRYDSICYRFSHTSQSTAEDLHYTAEEIERKLQKHSLICEVTRYRGIVDKKSYEEFAK